MLADVFTLLGELGDRRPTALVIDELQALLDLDPSLPVSLKGLLDAHPGVSLVASGSKARLMEGLFVARNAPLYNMAEHIALGPIPDDQMRAYLQRRAADGGKRMSESTAEIILRLAGPVPDDVQHLAFEAFETARGAARIDEARSSPPGCGSRPVEGRAASTPHPTRPGVDAGSMREGARAPMSSMLVGSPVSGRRILTTAVFSTNAIARDRQARR